MARPVFSFATPRNVLARTLASIKIHTQPKNIGYRDEIIHRRSGQCSASMVPANMTLIIEPMRATPCAQLTPVERIRWVERGSERRQCDLSADVEEARHEDRRGQRIERPTRPADRRNEHSPCGEGTRQHLKKAEAVSEKPERDHAQNAAELQRGCCAQSLGFGQSGFSRQCRQPIVQIIQRERVHEQAQPDQNRGARAPFHEKTYQPRLVGALFAQFLTQHEMRARLEGQCRVYLAQNRDHAIAAPLHGQKPIDSGSHIHSTTAMTKVIEAAT